MVACSDDVEEAKQILETSIGLHSGLEFIDIATFPGGVVCGKYSASSESGSDAREQPFITVGGRLYKHPAQLEWDIFCSQTPAQLLFNSTGIGLYDAGNSELAQVTADLSALDTALEAYYRDQFVYPSVEQGLVALASPPDNLPAPEKYPDGGYLAPIPLDPWGHPYRYEEEQWGRTKGKFTITTLGADGIEGGVGANADISTEYLPFLQHIAVVLEQS
jgi:type II secretion system protein G